MIHESMQFGKHNDVRLVIFGTGDISINIGKQPNDKHPKQIMFRQDDVAHNVGDTCDRYKGKTTDEMPRCPVVFQFDKIESIDAVIESLHDLRLYFQREAGADAYNPDNIKVWEDIKTFACSLDEEQLKQPVRVWGIDQGFKVEGAMKLDEEYVSMGEGMMPLSVAKTEEDFNESDIEARLPMGTPILHTEDI